MIKTSEKFDISYVDQSSINECSRCPAKYMFSRLMGLKQPDNSSIAMDFGTDMHLAVPHCYKEDISCVEEAAQVFNEAWDVRGLNDEKRNKLCARASLAEFQRLHKPSKCPYTILSIPDELKASAAQIISDNELPFTIDIGGPLPFIGRIDAVVKMKNGEGLWALDYKTSSEVSARYFANFDNAPQSVGYTLALNTTLNKPVEGMIIEAIRVSAKTVENQMYHVFVNAIQLMTFMEFANYISHIIISFNDIGEWPQWTSGCSSYGMFGQPGRVCEYKDLCTLTADWEEMSKYYKRGKPFHPFNVKEQVNDKETNT